MPDTEIHIPEEFDEIIEQRNQLWAKKEAAQREADKLSNYSSHFSTSSASTLGPLSVEGTPPDEIAQAIPLLEQELEKIRGEERKIQGYRSQIRDLEKRAKNTLFTVIGIGAFVAAAIICAIVIAASS
jgi:hypothetical protein